MGRGSLRWWGRWSRVVTSAIQEMPVTRDDTITQASKVLEEPLTHVDTAVLRTNHALVHDLSIGLLAVAGDGYLLEAHGARVAIAVHRCVEGDNIVTGHIGLATSTKSNIIPSGTGIGVAVRPALLNSTRCGSIDGRHTVSKFGVSLGAVGGGGRDDEEKGKDSGKASSRQEHL